MGSFYKISACFFKRGGRSIRPTRVGRSARKEKEKRDYTSS